MIKKVLCSEGWSIGIGHRAWGMEKIIADCGFIKGEIRNLKGEPDRRVGVRRTNSH